MRIAFIGSHSTGKTTVARPVADALDFPFLTEVVREVARTWGLTPATVPPHRVVNFQWDVLESQMFGERLHDEFVSDRSTLDNAAYFLAYAAHRATPEAVYNYLAQARNHMEKYDLLILIPPMFPPVDDGERHTDPREQERIHDIVCGLIGAWSVGDKVYTVTSGTVEDRLTEILEAINARKTKR